LKEKFNSQQETNQFHYFFLCFIKVAAHWQMVTLLFQKSRGKYKLQICNLSRFFSHKGKNLGDCIGCNFSSPAMLQDIIKPTALKNNIYHALYQMQ